MIHISQEFFKDAFELSKDLVDGSEAVDFADFAHALILGNDGHGLVAEGSETLAESLDVVVVTARSLRSFEDALDHSFLISINEDNEWHVD
jgi:hypothetical protein